MAVLKLYRERLEHNYGFLKKIFEEADISWGIVTKLLCGNKDFINEVLRLGTTEIHDSRLRNLEVIKKMAPHVQTVYIKPPPKRSIPRIVRWADVTFNTDYTTIKLLSEEAVRQQKEHKVIIMVEMGDLREGVMGDKLADFYSKVFELPNIHIVGLGANLNCLNGVMPNQDKLIQLCLYKKVIELEYGKEIPWVSGGTSVVVPLLMQQRLPKGVNHFRVGEILYFGNNLFTEEAVPGMETRVFELDAEIIDITEKPRNPEGELAANPSGETFEIDESQYGKTSKRAILDIGLLDVNPKYLHPDDGKLEVLGASSDMLVMDLGDNPKGYKVGDLMTFSMDYMGALALLNSDYIPKRVILPENLVQELPEDLLPRIEKPVKPKKKKSSEKVS